MQTQSKTLPFDRDLARRIAFWPSSHEVTVTYRAGTTGLLVRTDRGKIAGKYVGHQYRATNEDGGTAIYSMLPTHNSQHWKDVD